MLSYIELSKHNLLDNFNQFRTFIHPKTKMTVPIKGNAYGHGQNEVASILEDYADYFQVDDLLELRRLRKVSSKKTWVLGYICKDELQEVISLEGIPLVTSNEQAKQLNKLGEKRCKQISINLKFDVYHGRQGVQLEEAEYFIKELRRHSWLKIVAVGAHLTSADDPSDWAHTQKQIDEFQKIKHLMKSYGFNDIEYHISNTAGVLEYEKDKGENEIVRAGIGIYGMWPSPEIKEKYLSKIKLMPVIQWVTHVASVKNFSAGYPIGYNRTYITSQPTKVALIPQGYSDGYDRGLTNKGEVLINGTRCEIIGRVAMNMCMVDVSHLTNIQVEDEVVLLGNQGNERVTAEEIADKLDTINFEITTRISALLPRIIVK